MQTIRAARIREYGPVPVVDTIPRPQAGPGEVLVRVVAAGLNPIDNSIRRGGSPYALPPRLPAVAGTDMAGVVEEVGHGVKDFEPGDRVFGLIGGVGGLAGSLAELVSVDPALLATAPSRIPLREAAALPLVTLTAWEGLVDQMKVHTGQSLLVQGGAGGVGHVVIQLGIAFGAHVWATVSTADKADIVRGLGGAPLNYKDESSGDHFGEAPGGHGFDLVYDSVGDQALLASFRAVRVGGKVASCAAFRPTDLTMASLGRLSLYPLFVLHPLLSGKGRARHGDILRKVAQLVDAGQLHPIIDPRRFTLENLDEAYSAAADGSASVKIIVDIGKEQGPPGVGSLPLD